MKTLHARLHVYKPFGASLGLLPQPTSFDASCVHDDDGSITVTYSRRALNGDTLQRALESGLEIAVEVSDGTGYVEPANMRYLVTGRSGDSTDESDTMRLTGPSISWLLSKILNNDTSHLITDGDNKGKRAFLSSNPGTIIRTMLDENKTRGGASTGLSWDFDTAKDSGGDPWARVYTLYYSLGTSLQSALSSMVGGAAVDWRTNGRRLSVWNADSIRLSRDLSGSVRLDLTRDLGDAPNEESISDLSSDILVEGDNGLIFRQSNPAAPTPWGKWESYVSQGGVSDEATAKSFMQATLASSARVRGQYTRTIITTEVDDLPLIDYRPGDWITAPTVNHGEKTRVQQVTVSLDSEGKLSASIILNDIRYDASVRQAKKVAGITGGAALAGSEGGRPAPENDHRTPSAPQGLVVDTSAYLDSTGYARGLASLAWAQVSQATDNTDIDIASYRVDYRKSVAGAPWMAGGSTEASKTSLGIGNLECGVTYEFRVRAIPTYSDKPGLWSTVVVALVASDVTPPSVPSAPIASSDLSVVKLHWDGLTASGAHMERDFDHLDVAQGTGPNDLKVISANATGTGDYLVTGLTVGSKPVFAFRSVDHSGNASDWSVTAQVTVTSAVRPEDLKTLDDDIAANASAITDANKQIAQNKSDLVTANGKLSTAQSDIAKAKTDITTAQGDISANATAIATANGKLSTAQSDIAKAKTDITTNASAIEQARTAITNTDGKAQTALDKANSVSSSVDGLHNVYQGPTDPTTLANTTVRIGDTWRSTQAYWTRWQGDANNSPSLLADFYTYWTGDPNNSPSVLVTLDSRVTDVLVWDGLRWNPIDLVARNVIAVGTITGELVAANTIRGNSIIAGSISTDRIAALSITTPLLAALAVTVDKLAANSVNADKIVSSAVTADALAANSVTAAKIVAGAITARELAANSVAADELAANSVNASNIVSGAVTVDKLAANSVNASKIVAASITGDRLAANTITAREIKSQSITSDLVAAGQFTGYVFTGAVFQTSAAASRGIKLTATNLRAWDPNGNLTVDIDANTGSASIYGTFRTGLSGQYVWISKDFSVYDIDTGDIRKGSGIMFQKDGQAESPWISSASSSGGNTISKLQMSSGFVNGNDPGAYLDISSQPMDGTLAGDFWAGAMANISDKNSDEAYFDALSRPGLTYIGMAAQAGSNIVGIKCNATTARLSLGGALGTIEGYGTFQQASAWKLLNAGNFPHGTNFHTKFTCTPAKYGKYHAVANADGAWAGIIIHVENTGSASGWGITGYNADSDMGTDLYVDTIGWLN